MKKTFTTLLAPFLLLTLLVPSIAFGETMEDLVKREGIYSRIPRIAPPIDADER